MVKVNTDKKIWRNTGLCIAVSVVMGFAGIKGVQKLKAYNRANKFYEYLMQRPGAFVEKKDTGYIKNLSDLYKNKPIIVEEYLIELMADSTNYTKAVREDAGVINKFDRNISFDEAFDRLKQDNRNIVLNAEMAKIINNELQNVREGMALVESERVKNR